MEGREQIQREDRHGREMGVLHWLAAPRVRRFLKPLSTQTAAVAV